MEEIDVARHAHHMETLFLHAIVQRGAFWYTAFILFYKMLCPGKSNMNAIFICGTNVVSRTADAIMRPPLLP